MNKKLNDLEDIAPVKEEMRDEILTNPTYSLEVDPTGSLHMSQLEKTFTSMMLRIGYTNFTEVVDNLEFVSEQLGIELSEAKSLYWKINVQNEMERISKAMVARQFTMKSMNIENIKSYLTSMITDSNTSLRDRLTARDKLTAIKNLTNIIQFETELKNNTNKMDAIDVTIDESLEKLDADELKRLIAGFDENKSKDILSSKETVIAQMKGLNPSLTSEQCDFLMSLPLNELEGKLYSLRDSLNEAKVVNVEDVDDEDEDEYKGISHLTSLTDKLKEM